MSDLQTALAIMLGAQPPQMSPIPAPMSPIPGAAPPRPAGLPGLPETNFSPLPPGALDAPEPPQPNRLSPAEQPGMPMPEAPAPRPQVPASLLDAYAEMLGGSVDPDSLPSGEAQGGFGGFMQDLAAGVGGIRPTAPPAAAFGRGFSAAFGSRKARESAAAEGRAAAEEKAYGRRKEAMDLGFKLRDQEREDAADRRASESHADSRKASKLKLAADAVELQRKMLDAQGGLDVGTKQKIMDDVNGWMGNWVELNPTAKPDAIKAEAERKRKELEQYYAPRQQPAAPAQAPEAAPPPPTPAPKGKGRGDVPVASASTAPTFQTPQEVQAAIKSGKLKKGDRFMTPDGRMKVVP